MIQRIKTSNSVAYNLDKIQNKLHLSSKAAILRIAISLSLNDNNDLDLKLKYPTDKGFDISIATLFGEYEILFRALIKNSYKEPVNEQKYVRLIQAHIERGMVKLYGEFATNNRIEDFIEAII